MQWGGAASSIVDAIPRVFCSQARKEHVARGGREPKARLTLSSSGAASGQAKNEHLGSAELRFVGMRVSEWKVANAPNRSLKPAEQSKLRENAKAEYADICRVRGLAGPASAS